MSERVHPATQALLRFFEYSHPPPKLARVGRPFYGLARDLVANETLDGPSSPSPCASSWRPRTRP